MDDVDIKTKKSYRKEKADYISRLKTSTGYHLCTLLFYFKGSISSFHHNDTSQLIYI